MNKFLSAALLISSIYLTGCETTVVDRGGYRRPVAYRTGYYADDRGYERYRDRDRRDDRYRDHYRDQREDRYRNAQEVRVVRTNDGGYYRPTVAVQENVVVKRRSVSGRTKKKVIVQRKKKDSDRDRDDNKRKEYRDND